MSQAPADKRVKTDSLCSLDQLKDKTVVVADTESLSNTRKL